MGDERLIESVMTTSGQRLQITAEGVRGAAADSLSEVDPAQVDPAQVDACVRWFERAESTQEPTVSSFWLKHVVEHWAGTFISNGAVIIAAYKMGFPIGREPAESSANVTIGVATHCIDEFDCGCGHP
jgi:hypothetical protein